MDRITTFCFFASYALALGLELWHLLRPRPIFRLLGLLAGAAGLLAQTLYLYAQRPPLAGQYGWMLFLAWVLAIFYLCGSVHHRRQAWGVFVLPLIRGLLALGVAFGPAPPDARDSWRDGNLSPDKLWAPVHVGMLLLATVGV